MSQRHLLRFAIEIIRLVLLPFPLSLFLSMSALQISDHLLRPDRSNIVPGEAGEYIGGVLLIVSAVALQVVVGMPSLLALDYARSGARGYLATATTSALILSLLLATMLQAPQFGETLRWMFSRILLFLGIPLVLSYLLAFYLRRRREPVG